MRRSDEGAHIRERDTANRFDLTLQGGPNQHDTQKPRRTPRTDISPPRLELQEPAQRQMVSRAQCETTKSKHMHPHFSATTRLPQELGAGSCTFEARQYLAYRFRLPPTPGMRLVQFKHDQQGQQRYGPQSTRTGLRHPGTLSCCHTYTLSSFPARSHISMSISTTQVLYISI